MNEQECTFAYATEVAPRFFYLTIQPMASSKQKSAARREGSAKQLAENHATATARVRLWESRAVKARQNGRKADADRCDDKVRDWASKVRQAERIQNSEK